MWSPCVERPIQRERQYVRRLPVRRTWSVLLLTSCVGVLLGASPNSGTWRPGPGGFTSGSLSYVKTIPLETGAFDAVRHDDLLYVAAQRSFTIYDISDPEHPDALHREPVVNSLGEHPSTNGEILLMANDMFGELLIWDVSDPTDPEPLATHKPTRGDHIWECVADCRYAYGSHGTIVDLRDPAAPVEVGDWSAIAPADFYHAVTEVEPGLVLTGSQPMHLLDTRRDPTAPRLLATTETQQEAPPRGYVGGAAGMPARVAWPLTAPADSSRPADVASERRDRFVLVATETPFSGKCQETSGGFATYDTTGWRRAGTFELVDDLRITDEDYALAVGTYTDGNPAVNVLGCSPFAFGMSPNYGEDGLVAVAWMEHGVRLIEVVEDGTLQMRGGFIGPASDAARAMFVSDDLIYSFDLQRGIDVLRVTGG